LAGLGSVDTSILCRGHDSDPVTQLLWHQAEFEWSMLTNASGQWCEVLQNVDRGASLLRFRVAICRSVPYGQISACGSTKKPTVSSSLLDQQPDDTESAHAARLCE